MMQLGVFGNPVEHSRSPEIHQAFAAQVNLEIDYQKILVPLDEFNKIADGFFAQGGLGFNITVPFKSEAFDYCSHHSKEAELAGAVNTVIKNVNGFIEGHNTDGLGLVKDITKNLQWILKNKRILILGAGGAVQGIIGSLLLERPTHIHIYNRTLSKAKALVDSFSSEKVLAIEENQLESDYDVIISGTSAGLDGDAGDSLPAYIVGASTKAYDLIYSTRPTPFLRWAQNSGASECVDGLGMLVEQAAFAFEIWTNKQVVTSDVIKNLRDC
jgi:shikimate dehydrogenase